MEKGFTDGTGQDYWKMGHLKNFRCLSYPPSRSKNSRDITYILKYLTVVPRPASKPYVMNLVTMMTNPTWKMT